MRLTELHAGLGWAECQLHCLQRSPTSTGSACSCPPCGQAPALMNLLRSTGQMCKPAMAAEGAVVCRACRDEAPAGIISLCTRLSSCSHPLTCRMWAYRTLPAATVRLLYSKDGEGFIGACKGSFHTAPQSGRVPSHM